ncbi:MAG: acyltransferase [Bacteroidaceae bacterium]|nr:acyltransferase [Bacteroidaceae bacterium]
MSQEMNTSSQILSAPNPGGVGQVGVASSRMQWLDALRGFTMLLVVMYHVFTMGFNGNVQKGTSLTFMMLFRMPTFFFISGFLAYKASAVWTGDYLASMLWKKFKVQMIPTIVFLLANLLLLYPDFWKAFEWAMRSPVKGGYWFCWSLLHMFIIYYIIAYILERFRIKGAWPWIVVWLISVCIYATLYMPSWFSWHKAPFWQYSSLVRTAEYFQFFVAGILVHRYWNRITTLMDTAWFYPIVLFLAFICCAENFHLHHFRLQWANLPRTIAIYSLVFIVVMFFRYYEHWFTRDRWVGASLQYIGTRTLDVYLLHYFFIPTLPMVGAWLKTAGRNFVLETIIPLAMAIVVVAFSLLASNIIRVSPFYKKWFFGR